MMTPRELIRTALEFKNPERVPRNMWSLPCAHMLYAKEIEQIQKDYPSDIVGCPGFYKERTIAKGNAYAVGNYTDPWGCVFINLQKGIIGEVKDPLVKGENWEDADKVHIPEEWLSIDVEKINEFCKGEDHWINADCCPRPFEQLQYIRGTEALYIDLMDPPEGMLAFIEKMHDFYCRLLEKWAQTDVDGLGIMDDWGSQKDLLINPEIWRKIFKPMYQDYINIAHRHGKKMFMHSDGNILRILPELVEMGLDAINSQLFCMGLDKMAEFRGKICFWGEIDRQNLLPYGTPQEIEKAVRNVKDALWENGGCIAQCEFGAGAKPENVRKVFETWSALEKSGG